MLHLTASHYSKLHLTSQHTAHCTLHTAHCTLHTAHCTLHTALSQSNLSMAEDGSSGVVVGGGTTREYMLEDEDCPLQILMNHQVRETDWQAAVKAGS